MGPVPDRWFNYSRLGQVIPGTPFIACKTPLKLTIERENRFTPEDLIESIKDLGKNLVLVVDLTYTKRYYNKDEFKDIQHVKIFTQGKVVPSPSIVSQFFDAVDSIRHKLGKDDIIAVHCTHGVNRTGYFICRYMIDKLNFDPHNAIEEFNLARGHNIERENYLHSLKNETFERPADSVCKGRSRGEIARPQPPQRWSAHHQNPSPSYQRQPIRSFYNGGRYQDGPRNFPPRVAHSPRNQSYHYYQGPNQYQEYRDYHYDDRYRHLSNQFKFHQSPRYSREDKYGNTSRQSSYRDRGQKRDRWRDYDY